MAEPSDERAGDAEGLNAVMDDLNSNLQRNERLLELDQIRKLPKTNRQRLNLYAVVVECKDADHSKGCDFFCSFKIMDSSLVDVEEFPMGMDGRVFAKELKRLPANANDGGSTSHWLDLSKPGRKVECGDILRMHRAWYEGKTVVGQLDKGASLCLFTSDPGDPIQPYWSSHPNVKKRAVDDAKVTELRKFSGIAMRKIKARIDQGMSATSFDRRFEELEDRAFCDLFVMVLKIDEKEDGSKLLWIWDGTDVKPQLYKVEHQTTIDADSQASELRQLNDESVQEALSPAMSALRDFPEYGTIMPVTFSDKIGGLDLTSFDGKWVKLRNIIVHSVCGQMQAFYHSNSSISVLHNAAIQSRRENYEQRMRVSTSDPWPSTHFSTGSSPRSQTVRKNLPVVSLRKVLRATFERGPVDKSCLEYRCKVRVLKCDSVGDFCKGGSGDGEGPSSSASAAKWVFGVMVHLEDATGDIMGVLYGSRAEEFFGIPACDLSDDANSQARRRLDHASSKLMDLRCWLECCLLVVWGPRSEKPTFLITDTKMNLDDFEATEDTNARGSGGTERNAAGNLCDHRTRVGGGERKRRHSTGGGDEERERAKRRHTIGGA